MAHRAMDMAPLGPFHVATNRAGPTECSDLHEGHVAKGPCM